MVWTECCVKMGKKQEAVKRRKKQGRDRHFLGRHLTGDDLRKK